VLVVLLGHPCPEAGSRSRRDSYAAFLLLFHPVHHGSAVMHLSYLVRYTGIEKDALCGGRFTRINMGHDAYIAILLDWGCARHGSSPVICLETKTAGLKSPAAR
jgi:hypothetical protein